MSNISKLIRSKLLEIERLKNEIDIAYKELINTYKIGEEINIYFNALDDKKETTGLPVKRKIKALIHENEEYLIGVKSEAYRDDNIIFISPLQVKKISEDNANSEKIMSEMITF